MPGKTDRLIVPIFPLNTVLLPKMPLALHVFEERYKVMIKDFAETDKRFCVALIEEGEEVGGDARPCSVACLADVLHVRSLPGGRYFLIAMGFERVRIVSTDRLSKPYLVGTVELWPDEASQGSPDLVSKASSLFTQYSDLIMKLSGEKLEDFTLPEEPDALSYMLASAIQIDSPQRQLLLEMPTTERRLKAEVDLLQTELPMLRLLAAGSRPPEMANGRFSAN